MGYDQTNREKIIAISAFLKDKTSKIKTKGRHK